MAKKKIKKKKDEDFFDSELEGIINQNEHMKTGMKKIINSIENNKTKSNNQKPKQ